MICECDVFSKTAQLVRELGSTLPKHLQWRLKDLSDDVENHRDVLLADIVAACCRTLDECRLSPLERKRFADAAWGLVAFIAGDVLKTARGRVATDVRSSPGEVLRVPPKTHFMVGLLLARNPDPRQVLLATSRGPVSRYDLSRHVKSVSFVPEASEASRLFQFESLLWDWFFPSEGAYSHDHVFPRFAFLEAPGPAVAYRRALHDRLEAAKLKEGPYFVMVGPGTAGEWKALAAAVKGVVFVEPEEGDAFSPGEDKLAYLTNDLLKLTEGRHEEF